jgi:hypothetical protein
MRRFTASLHLFCIFAWAHPVFCDDIDTSLWAQIQKEAPKGWQECESVFDSLSCRIVSTQKLTGSLKSHMASKPYAYQKHLQIYSRLPACEFLVVWFDPEWRTQRRRDAFNAKYNFSVTSGDGGQTWALSNGAVNADTITANRIVRMLRSDAAFMMGSTSLMGVPLTEFLTNETQFKLAGCRLDKSGDEPTALLNFRCRHPTPFLNGTNVELKLLPGKSWILSGWRSTDARSGGRASMKYELATLADGKHHIKAAELVRENRDEGDHTEVTIDVVGGCDVDSDEFWLRQYGISESAILPSAVPQNWIQYVLVALGVCSLGWGFFLWRRS